MPPAKRKWPVSSRALKWIALVIMLIDHIGIISYDWLGWSGRYLTLRFIGRNAFPIFAFLLVEGFRHTRNRWAYLRNLLIFAVISEIPYDLINNWERPLLSQNIFWALSLGLLGMIGAETIAQGCDKLRLPRPLSLLCALIPMAAAVYMASVIRVDYGYWSVLLILMIYGGEIIALAFLAGDKARNVGAALAAVLWMVLYDIAHRWTNEIYGLPAVLLISLYNGERGQSRLPKWFFYGFYPAHFLILQALRLTAIPWLFGSGYFR